MTLRGTIEGATRERVHGWAQDGQDPATRATLLIAVNDQFAARVTADRPREDLRRAGIGDGEHSFDVALKGLSPLHHNVIAVVDERDGSHLPGSPVVVEPAGRFDAEVQAHCATLFLDAADDAALVDRLGFLATQTEALLQLRAERRARRSERMALRQIQRRWGASPEPAPIRGRGQRRAEDAMPPRALFIDHALPLPTRDAGSAAVLSHMLSLRRLGFEVGFVGADMAPDRSGVLDGLGIAHYPAPWHGSVEEVLRREAESFDLVYLHRGLTGERYLPLVRAHQPRARVIYSVADLYHLRVARQAAAEDRPELEQLARRIRRDELRLAAMVDVVVTHSPHEAAILREHIPPARVHVVPWSVPARPTCVAFERRSGMAFIGHYGHAPNHDAALWLIEEIMPCLRAFQPGITCLLVGSDMPQSLRRTAELGQAGVEAIGQVAALAEVFDRVRLTIAPLTFGAGIKGKVLDSLAAGIPCVCTPLAAEGLDLPAPLRALIASDAAGLAASAARLHEDARLNQACAEAGLAYVAETLGEPRIDALMREVAGLGPDEAMA